MDTIDIDPSVLTSDELRIPWGGRSDYDTVRVNPDWRHGHRIACLCAEELMELVSRFRTWRRGGGSLRDPWVVAEAIASRDRNNLYLASSFLRDRDRYRSFCANYAIMRVIDDRVDALPARETMPQARRDPERAVLAAWQSGIEACYEGRVVHSSVVEAADSAVAQALLDAFAESLLSVRPPLSLWNEFFGAMRWDLECDRVETWREFLQYAEGASVAPTTIYLFLLTSRTPHGATSTPEGFDITRCGRELGLFAYLAHIVRDTAEDLRTGDKGLIYYAKEDLDKHGVSEELLFRDLRTGRASAATRALVADVLSRARRFLAAGRTSMQSLSGQLDPDCEFVLELIVTVYARVIEKIEACSFDPFRGGHRLTANEKRSIFTEVASRVGFTPAGARLDNR